MDRLGAIVVPTFSQQFLPGMDPEPDREVHDPMLDALGLSKMEPSDSRKAAEQRSTDLGYRQLAHAPVSVRAPLKALRPILQTGDLRSQHETGQSGGFLGPTHRADWEKNVGFPDHPVYGYLDTQDSPARPERATGYGGAKFRLKGSVRDRTTVINGDSLDSEVSPVPLRDAERGAGLPHYGSGERNTGIDGRPYIEGYIEAQVHEPLAWASQKSGRTPSRPTFSRVGLDEVSTLDIDWDESTRAEDRDFGQDTGPEARRNLGQQFADKGVSVWHHEREGVYQPPLPFSEPELADQGFETGGSYRAPGQYHRYGPGVSIENAEYRTRMRHQSQL